MAKESFEQELLLVSKASSPQAERKWLVTQKSRRYLKLCANEPRLTARSQRKKQWESCNFSSWAPTWEFQFSGLSLCKVCISENDVWNRLQRSLVTSTTCLAPPQRYKPSLLLLKFGSENTNPSSRPSEHFVNHSASLAWVQCADDVFSVGRG